MFKAYKITADREFQEMLQQSQKIKSLDMELNSILNKLSKLSLEPKLLNMIKKTTLAKEGLQAESIWNEWFPEINADVFISHSSKDVDLAKRFSVWLENNFNLKTFIDSEIWGHSDKLLKCIDKDCCFNEETKTYSYEKRNGSTAHVHMMLSYALTRMIDKTECFIFLESNNSVTAQDSISGTYSPWIFHELAAVDTIKIRKPRRGIPKTASVKYENFSESHELKVKYPILGNRLIEIGNDELNKWKTLVDPHNNALDVLYELTTITENGG